MRVFGLCTGQIDICPAHLDDLLSGLRHLQNLGLVHNDVHPGNSVVDGSGDDAKRVLIDFDSCRPIGVSLTATLDRRTHASQDRR